MPSGSGSSAATSAVKQTSAMYNFLQWLDPYVTSRNATTNIRIEPQKSETDEIQLSGEEQEDRDDDGIDDLESTRCLTQDLPITKMQNTEKKMTSNDYFSSFRKKFYKSFIKMQLSWRSVMMSSIMTSFN